MERLFTAIPAVLKNLGTNAGTNAGTEKAVVIAAWSFCAGNLLSERTAAVDYLDKRLVVAAADETWRRHLEDLSPQLLARLNSHLGSDTVTFIHFVVDPAAINAVIKCKMDASGEIELDPGLTEAALNINDGKLREQFVSAAAAYLSRQKRNTNGR